ncbi:MAG: transcription elongation factor GreA, partial [Bacilli bacterium]|nr:transcription elongation factor GreA [Bacilli bacterium]
EYVEDKETEEYTIVGSKEADPFQNKISNESPIAKAILGLKVGEVVSVESPNGKYDVKIVEIA